jgi:TIGR03009 family protein
MQGPCFAVIEELSMRTFLPVVAVLAIALFPATSPCADEADAKASRLDDVLCRWHQKMGKIQSLSCQFEKTMLDRVYQSTQTVEGTALFLKPDCVVLESREKGTKAFDFKVLCDSKTIYQYDASRKEIIAIDKDSLIAALSYWPLKTLLKTLVEPYRSLLLGTEPSEMKKRYDLKLLEENQWYYFILITPRTRDAAAGLTRARLTLYKSSYLPRQLWLEEPNGNEYTWDFLHLNLAPRLDRKDFTFTLPAGWHLRPSP